MARAKKEVEVETPSAQKESNLNKDGFVKGAPISPEEYRVAIAKKHAKK